MNQEEYTQKRRKEAYETLDKTIDTLENLTELSYNFGIDYIDEILFQFKRILETIQDKENIKSVQLESIKDHCKHIEEYSKSLEVRKK